MARKLYMCRADQQNGRPPGRPRKPKSSVNSVGRPGGRPISTAVDRSVDRALITWACARLVHIGRPVGRPPAAQSIVLTTF